MRSSVTPAISLNSPPAIVVGTLIWRTVGGLIIGGATPLRTRMSSMPSTVADIVGKAKLHRLGAVGDRAAAHGDDQVGLGFTRLVGRGDHRFARRMRAASRRRCRHSAAQRLADLLDLVGLPVQRAR